MTNENTMTEEVIKEEKGNLEESASTQEGEGKKVETAKQESEKKKTRRGVKALIIAVIILLLLVLVLYLSKNFFIAATVDGQPVSRLALIKELETRSGQQALEAMIFEYLIVAEANRQGVVTSQSDVDNELKQLEERLSEQGTTLEAALAMQGLSRNDLARQISIQKNLEALLGERVEVSDEEVNTYLQESQMEFNEEEQSEEEDFREQVREMLKSQKMGEEAPAYIEELKSKAQINYFGPYSAPPAPTETQL